MVPRVYRLVWLVLCLAVVPVARGDDAASPDFSGRFKGEKISVEFVRDAGNYSGIIHLGDAAFPLSAQFRDGKLVGTFRSQGMPFDFTATLAGPELSLFSGGNTFRATRQANNPLAAVPPADPTAPAAAPGDDPAGHFYELGATATGRALYATLASAKTFDAAIQITGDVLGKILDAKPQFTNAMADRQSKTRGMASFTGKVKGNEAQGIVLVSIDAQKGACVSVIYSRPDAPKAEVQALMASLPARQQMRTFKLPDGSGTVDLPQGWTTASQSMTDGPLIIAGPAGQMIMYNNRLTISTPNSPELKIYRQNAAQLQRFGANPGPPPPGPFLPYSSPDQVIQTLLPQLNETGRKAGRDWLEFDKVIDASKAEPNPLVQGSQAGLYFQHLIAHSAHGAAVPLLRLMKIDTLPGNDAYWQIYMNGYTAPQATFEHDLPIMKDIMESCRLDPGALQRQGNRDQDRTKALLEAGEKAHQDLLARGRQYDAQRRDWFDHFEANQRARSQARHDANSDFIEMVRGYRDVYDTATGETHSVNYYNVNDITNAWNAAANDPSRFVQVPLRYER